MSDSSTHEGCQKHDGIEKDVNRVAEETKEQWTHIGRRTKTSTLITVLSVCCTVLIVILGASYAVSQEEIEDIKEVQKIFQKAQQKQYEQLMKKQEDIKELMNQLNVNMMEVQTLIKKESKDGR